MENILKPYKEETVITYKQNIYSIFDEKLSDMYDEKSIKKHTAKGIIKLGTVINCSLYKTSSQYIAVFVLYKNGESPSLKLQLTNTESKLFSEKKIVTSKSLITESSQFHMQLINKCREKFLTSNKGIYGTQYVSNGTKLIHIFTSHDMMTQNNFTQKIQNLL